MSEKKMSVEEFCEKWCLTKVNGTLEGLTVRIFFELFSKVPHVQIHGTGFVGDANDLLKDVKEVWG